MLNIRHSCDHRVNVVDPLVRFNRKVNEAMSALLGPAHDFGLCRATVADALGMLGGAKGFCCHLTPRSRSRRIVRRLRLRPDVHVKRRVADFAEMAPEAKYASSRRTQACAAVTAACLLDA